MEEHQREQLDEMLELERQIFELTSEHHLHIIFGALNGIMTFHMSMACPSCRELIAEKLKGNVPIMLAHANELAASYPDGEPDQHFGLDH